MRGLRRSAEPDGQRVLHRREQEPAALQLLVAAVEIDGLAGEKPPEDRQELGGVRIALVMRQEDAVAREFLRIASGDEVDEEAAVADAVERGGLTGPMGGRREAGPERGQKLQTLGMRGERRRGDPGIFAMRADRDQDAAEAELVGRLGDLLEVGKIGRAVADIGPEIRAVSRHGDEPEDIERLCGLRHAEVSLLSDFRNWTFRSKRYL